ncbi:MAG: hypothetical protein J7527_05830 [Chitinophagaceae bacterium]|nr:hypothetical protein [Chitinophagaceae bacterium]
MKRIIFFLLSPYSLTCLSQVQPLGTVVGNQTVINVKISQYDKLSQALIYYPDDYFLPENANKRYPLFIFLHGAGEGNGSDIRIVNNTSLPQLIAGGMKPVGTDSVTGEKVKFIVISPFAANTNYSYSFDHVRWILPDVTSTYRVDTTCMWVGGLSAGGRGAWSMAREDQAISSKLAGIVPVSAMGYEKGTDANFNAAIKNGLAVFSACGSADAHVTTARTMDKTIKGLIGANTPQRYWYYEVPGVDHNSNAWTPPFNVNNRFFNPTKSLWDLMANIRRGKVTPPPVTPPVVKSLTVTMVAPTEYRCAWLYSDGKIRRYKFVNSSLIIDTMNIGDNKNIANISAGFNSTLAVATDGTVFLNRQGGAVTNHLSTDTLGRTINDAVKCWGYFYDYMFLRADGSVWYFGNDDYGFLPGTAVITKPIQISPAGMKVKDVAMGGKVLFLTESGEVWERTKNSTAAVKKTLPAPAIGITTGYLDYSVAIVPEAGGPANAGYPYAWGNAYKYWGGSSAASQPVALKTLWDVKQPIKQIVSSSNALHWIDVLGVRRGIGDNGNGEIGTGDEKYNKQELWSNPYSGAWHEGDPAFMITKPYELAPPAPGRVWNKLWSSVIFNFYVWASDDKDSTYFNGREKSLVGAKGIQLQNESDYPNGLDQVIPEQRTIIKNQPVVFKKFEPYKLSAGPDLSIKTDTVTLKATGVASTGYTTTGYNWKQLSGPGTAGISSPGSATTIISGLKNGTYRFAVQMIDNAKGSISDTVQVVVALPTANKPPVVSAGSDTTYTLPIAGFILEGFATDESSKLDYKWTKQSGPAGGDLVMITTTSAFVEKLQAGEYVYRLTVTDEAGASGYAERKVVILPAKEPEPVDLERKIIEILQKQKFKIVLEN